MDLDEGRVVFGAHNAVEEITEVQDPVCGMAVDKFATPFHTIADARAYFFCSEVCQRRFEAEPSSFVPPPAAP